MECGKGISIFFKDGNYESLMRVSGTNWRGLIYVVPRRDIEKMLEVEEAKRFGVYILLSETQIYIGEASDLKNRIKQHDKGKRWWERAVLITTTDDSLDQTDINYLETTIINIAKKQKNLKCENKQLGNKIKLDDMKKAGLDSFLKDVLGIMNVLNILKINSKSLPKDKDDVIGRLEYGNGSRQIAIQYLKEKGFVFPDGFKYNYSARQKEKENSTYKNECWINPNVKMLDCDWFLILNDTERRILHVLNIPQGTFHIKSNTEEGFKLRTDNGKIDMFVNLSTFVDRKSGLDLAKYLVGSYDY